MTRQPVEVTERPLGDPRPLELLKPQSETCPMRQSWSLGWRQAKRPADLLGTAAVHLRSTVAVLGIEATDRYRRRAQREFEAAS